MVNSEQPITRFGLIKLTDLNYIKDLNDLNNRIDQGNEKQRTALSVELHLGLNRHECLSWIVWRCDPDPTRSSLSGRKTQLWADNWAEAEPNLTCEKAHHVVWNINLAADHWPVSKKVRKRDDIKKKLKKNPQSDTVRKCRWYTVAERRHSGWFCANREKLRLENQSTKCTRLLPPVCPLLSVFSRQWRDQEQASILLLPVKLVANVTQH